MSDKMDLVLSQLKELHMIVTSIRDRQEETDAKIEAMAMDLHQLNGRVGGLEGRMDRLEGRMDRLESRMDRLESRMDNLQLELSDFRRETALNFSRNDRHIQAIERELDQTKYRVGQLEEELKRTGT